MSPNSSATTLSRPVVSTRTSTGIWWGLLGVVAFSFTVPLTRVAVEGMSPLFIGAGRAVVAALLAALALAFTRQRFPRGTQWIRLAVVAGGIVAGFPLLTTFALTSTSASHGAIVIALLPAATATVAVLRGRERPRLLFWILTAVGVVAALVFALVQSGGFGSLHWADLLLLGAVVAAAIGYAEGGLLARELGSWKTISWALVVAAPAMILLTLVSLGSGMPQATPLQWLSFAYLGVVSMFLGFFAWYRGLAIGPMAQVSQIQLVQPVMTIAWAGLLLGEPLTWTTVVGGLAVILCAGAAVRVRLRK
ncbi:DMT family transporter [Paenarthrobacter sp. OM7]|uniref:DMT family transporter n=1 Tax=Paenarthrobacter sp. OM7 TaxID=3041264 RepID=UPI002468CE49|nr:DMT family transporter [Paenarthrobacter sp. OM7]WGM20948.1 DMT family transporter [Paenarthrobacter sp. OM7]